MMNIAYMKVNGQMNYNTDGFNERSIYIHNSLDRNKHHSNFDNSFAQMRALEHKNDVTTVNSDKSFNYIEAKGERENFVLRNNNMRNSLSKPSDSSISRALNRTMFKN